MIPTEHDDTMIVTMTKGDLAALVSKIAEEAAEKAVNAVVLHVNAANANKADTDTLVGGEAIAKAIGVSRDTMYRMIRSGRLSGAIHRIGGKKSKLIADRRDIISALASV